MLCRSLLNAPEWLASLIHHESWSGCYGTRLYLFFTFSVLEKRAFLFHQYNLSQYTANDISLVPLDETGRALARQAFTMWSDIANIVIIEDTRQAHLYVFNFLPLLKSSVLGFASLPPRTPGVLGVTSANNHLHHYQLRTLLHEIGHFLGLVHPFENPGIKHAFQNLTSFSVMNYKYEFDQNGRKLLPMSPMPADYDALQFIYGTNTRTGIGNNVYQLNDFLFESLHTGQLATITTLPWDAGGVDTLSAKNMTENALINLRPYQRSRINAGYIIMPNIDVENVVGSAGENIIVLNALPNVVDVRDSKRSTLWLNPEDTGNDKVLGFRPDIDRIILEEIPGKKIKLYRIVPAPPGNIEILNETVHYSTGTQIIFSEQHSITLANVHPRDMSNHTMQLRPALPGTRHPVPPQLDPVLEQTSLVLALANNLCIDFLKSASASAFLNSGFTLLNYLFKRLNFDESANVLLTTIMQVLPVLSAGDYSTLAILLSFRFHFNSHDALIHSNSVLVANSCMSNASSLGLPQSIVKSAAVLIGSWAGSQFSLWAHKKMTEYFSDDELQISIQPKTTP